MQAIYIEVIGMIGMGKVLYVRGFDENLHDKLSDQSKKEGVSPASILEEAYQDWLKNRKGVPAIHYLLFYSDEKSLLNFIKKAQNMLDEKCVKLCAGPSTHSAIKFLKKNGWIDGTNTSYTQGIKNTPEKYTSKVFDRLGEIASGRYSIFMGFMTESVAFQHSLKKANEVERIYNTKRVPGVVFCPYDMTKLKNYSLRDLIELFKEHDKGFIVEGNDVYDISITNTNLPKLFL